MARFPIQRTERTISGRAPVVRARLDVSTGEGAVAEAISGLGAGITALGEKYDLKQANTQFSEYKRKVGEDNIIRNEEINKELSA